MAEEDASGGFAAGTTGSCATEAFEGLGFSATGSIGFGRRLAARSAQSCLPIERAVSSVPCVKGFKSGGWELADSGWALAVVTGKVFATGTEAGLPFSATESVDLVCRFADKSAQSCLRIERAVSSTLAVKGFKTGGWELADSGWALAVVTGRCCAAGTEGGLLFSATEST